MGEGIAHAGVEPRWTRLFRCLTFKALAPLLFTSLAPRRIAFSFPARVEGVGLKIVLGLTSVFGVAGPALGLRTDIGRLDLAGVDGGGIGFTGFRAAAGAGDKTRGGSIFCAAAANTAAADGAGVGVGAGIDSGAGSSASSGASSGAVSGAGTGGIASDSGKGEAGDGGTDSRADVVIDRAKEDVDGAASDCKS